MKYLTPTCNQLFTSKCIINNKRIDGRKRDEFRNLSIGFGLDFGCVLVSLGNSKVLASITCDIIEPSINRSYEGLIKLNLDLSPMASPFYELNKLNDECVEISRMLERSILLSKCVDLESLCVIAGEKVWEIRVDLIILNADGNLAEVCSIALTTALLHFKRPHVSVVDEQIKIHSFEEKHPLSINLLCYPFCTKFVFYDNSLIVCDPTEDEELNALGYLILGSNNFKEVTAIHITGKSQIIKNVVLKCCTTAWERTNFLMQFIKSALGEDKLMRTDKNIQNNQIGFVPLIKSSTNLFTFRKGAQKIEIEEQEIKETNEDINEIDETYLTKMYRFKTNTDAISQEEDKESINANWKNGKKDLNVLEMNDDDDVQKID